MKKWMKVIALAIAAAAVIVLAYAVLTPAQATDENHVGMWGRPTYSSQNVLLMGISIVVIVAMLMIALMWQEYEPLPPTMAPPVVPEQSSRAAPPAEPTAAKAEEKAPEDLAARNYLVLRLLTGDERVMFKALMDAGGEALQKDLIVATKMSNAKVSRVLDRLAAKGVISKERYGATNKIRIRLDR